MLALFSDSYSRDAVFYLFSVFKESRGQALRDPLEHQFVLKMTNFLGQVCSGRASPHATSKTLNRYVFFNFWREKNLRVQSSLFFVLG